MPLTPAEVDQKIDEHFGFEARDDVAGVLSTLAGDVEHDVVGWPAGPARGRDQTRPFYEALFADLADGQVTCIRRLYGDGFMVDESLWKGRAVGRISRPSRFCSRMWADQPATRAQVNIGVNRSGGTSA